MQSYLRPANARFLIWNHSSEDWEKYAPQEGDTLETLELAYLSHYNSENIIEKFQQETTVNPFVRHINRTKSSENLDGVGGRAMVYREEGNVAVSPLVYLDVSEDYEIRVGLQVRLGWSPNDLAICNHPEVGFHLFKALVVSLVDEDNALDCTNFYSRFLSSLDSWAVCQD